MGHGEGHRGTIKGKGFRLSSLGSAGSWPLLGPASPHQALAGVLGTAGGGPSIRGRFHWGLQDLKGALATVPRAQGCWGRAGTQDPGASGQVCEGQSLWDPRAGVWVYLKPSARTGADF